MENENRETCTQCHKECSADALRCGRGKAYFSNKEGHGECKHGHSRHGYDKNDLAHLLMRSGHIIAHKGEKKRGQTRILHILAESPDISQKELQERLDIEAGSLSELINKLESRELVLRKKDTEDKRKMRISLTEKGHEVLKERQQKQKANEEQLFGMLSEEEKETLRLILIKIMDQWHEDHHIHKRGRCNKHGHGHGKGHKNKHE